MESAINIDEYLALELERLLNFKKHWVEQHLKDPENYPPILTEGDWAEQHAAYNELKEQ